MRFGTYLFALVLPPFYLFRRRKIVSGVITLGMWGLALLLILSIFLAPFGAVMWLVASVVALFEARRQVFNEQAEMLATKMAEKMRQNPPPVVGAK